MYVGVGVWVSVSMCVVASVLHQRPSWSPGLQVVLHRPRLCTIPLRNLDLLPLVELVPGSHLPLKMQRSICNKLLTAWHLYAIVMVKAFKIV